MYIHIYSKIYLKAKEEIRRKAHGTASEKRNKKILKLYY